MKSRRRKPPENTVIRFALALATLAVLACVADDNPDPQVRREVGAPPSSDTIWQVTPEPALVLGRFEELEEQQFYQIRGAVRLSTGVVVVLDGASRELRAFSPDGTHLWTAGGPGDGPGELRNPVHLEKLRGDILQVQDGVARIRYGPDGSVVAHEQLAVANLLEFGQYYAWECPLPSFVGDQVLASQAVVLMPRISPARPDRGEARPNWLCCRGVWTRSPLWGRSWWRRPGRFAPSNRWAFPRESL